jgi:P22 coat protein - gene protein 5
MANNILTLNVITREAIQLWKNTNAFLQNVDQQYDNQFAQTGAKAGTQIRIRLPNDFVVRKGAAMQVQDTSEQSVTLVVATQAGVDIGYSTVDRTMSLDDYSERVLAPAINVLTGQVALDLMAGSEGGIANIVSNLSGTTIISPVANTFLNAGAYLDNQSAPGGRRKVINSTFTEARTVGGLAGLFNPQADIAKQYRLGMMGQALGFDWMKDQTAITHTMGSFTAGTVNGGGQTGNTLIVNAITGTLNQGDIINIAGVVGVNRITKQSYGMNRQFVVTANVASGATSIPIYPAIVPAAANGNAVQYQTVVASPANGAAITFDPATPVAGTTYRKNFALAPQAVTLAFADLELPMKSVEESAREAFDGVSMRMLTTYVPGTDQLVTRLDVLYGSLWVRPEWACVVCDQL